MFLLTVHFDGTLPRLFFNKFTQPNAFKEPTEQLYVIEYAAYQELLKENEELKKKLEAAVNALSMIIGMAEKQQEKYSRK